ncbi:MAG: ABC transporter permease [Lachnospiraceae bacterium]
MHFKNPIFEMELKLKMKNVSVPVLIMLYNVFFALISTISLINFSDLNSVRYDNAFLDLISVFFILGILQYVFIFLLVPIFTASAIAGERERGTLDLLLVSSMRPVQIILGKLAANISIILLFNISSMPILSVGFILGGVGRREIAVSSFILLLMAFYCSSIGVYCSCQVNKKIVACVLTGLIEFLFTIGNIGMMLFLEKIKIFTKVAGYLLVLNPLTLVVWLYDEFTNGNNMMYLLGKFFKVEQTSRIYFILPKIFLIANILIQIGIGIIFIYLSVRCLRQERE